MNPHVSSGYSALDGRRVQFSMGVDDAPDRTLSHGVPARPLLGGLPIARLIPQDIHSVMDYMNGVSTGLGVLLGREPAAIAASMILGGSVIGVSAVTDYRLSIKKLIPIELHEKIDYAWGITAIAAPFLLGYWKKSPTVALMHVISGVGTILSSLVTDYRAYRAV